MRPAPFIQASVLLAFFNFENQIDQLELEPPSAESDNAPLALVR